MVYYFILLCRRMFKDCLSLVLHIVWCLVVTGLQTAVQSCKFQVTSIEMLHILDTVPCNKQTYLRLDLFTINLLNTAGLQLHCHSRKGPMLTVRSPPTCVCQTLQVKTVIRLLVRLTDGVNCSLFFQNVDSFVDLSLNLDFWLKSGVQDVLWCEMMQL